MTEKIESRFDELVRSKRKDIKLEEILAELLIDDVSVHFLDSGFYRGRHFQQHQDSVEQSHMKPEQYFKSQPHSVFHLDEDGDIDVWHHNLYHWLLERVKYDHEKTRKFYNFIDFMYTYNSEGWWPVRGVAEGVKSHLKWLHQVRFATYTYDVPQNRADTAALFMLYIWPTWKYMNIKWDEQPRERLEKEMQRILKWIDKHPDGDEDVYSAIGNLAVLDGHMLSQGFEAVEWDTGGWCQGWGAAISIHQGADIRGGYSSVIFVRSSGRQCDHELYDTDYCTLYCDNESCGAYWDFESCGNYEISNSGENGGTQVKPFPKASELGELVVRNADGKATGEMLCPHCKKGHLRSGW